MNGPAAPARRRRRILVVDDDGPMLQLTGLLLEEAGFDVTSAQGGQAGIDAFRRCPDAIDAVVLDLAMPDVSGDQVLREIRSLRAEVPVVLISGYRSEVALGHFGSDARAEFLHKPFEPETLLGKLVEALSLA